MDLVVPDRADAPVSEITERFLRTVIAAIPLERIEELHLFSPLRQGGVETGIAVVAVTAATPAPVEPTAPERLDLEELVVVDAGDDKEDLDDLNDLNALEALVAAEAGEDLDDGDDLETAEAVEAVITADAVDTEDASAEAPAVAPSVPIVVYTARYRLVQKGPERGKWESDVVAEADAPLITVEAVVRGVQRRAGEESEIVRYSAAQLAKALRLP
jgi:hypothetical protein